MYIGVIVGTVVIPLLGIIMGLMYMNDANPSKKGVGRTWLWVGVGALALQCICGCIYAMLTGMFGGQGGF